MSAKKRHVLPPNGRKVLKFGITAVVLAGVILGAAVASNLLQPQKPSTVGPTTSAPSGASQYTSALSALASGDTTRATSLLEDSAAKGYEPAKKKLAEIRASREGTASVPTTDALSAGVADLTTLLPASLSGYRLTDVETSTASAIVSGDPSSAPGLGVVSRIALTVYDRATTAGAEKWLARFDKAFSRDVADVRVAGIKARFGTDGAHLASVVFVRGRYGFEVVATAVRGNPSNLRSIVTGAAASFPAARSGE